VIAVAYLQACTESMLAPQSVPIVNITLRQVQSPLTEKIISLV
jgi:hypothetical protein